MLQPATQSSELSAQQHQQYMQQLMVVASLQQQQRLAVDGGRTFAFV